MSSQTLTRSLLHQHQHRLIVGPTMTCRTRAGSDVRGAEPASWWQEDELRQPQVEPSGGGRPQVDEHRPVKEVLIGHTPEAKHAAL